MLALLARDNAQAALMNCLPSGTAARFREDSVAAKAKMDLCEELLEHVLGGVP